MDNYIKAYKIYQDRLSAPDLSREDRETILLEKEREKEEFEAYKTVERIIGQRDATDSSGNSYVEYFCKWNGLNYEHCTWEPHDKLIEQKEKPRIEAFRTREAEAKFPFKSQAYARHSRPKFKKLQSDPPYLVETGGELKEFQLTGLNWLSYLWCNGENGILADEMGLGKVRLPISVITVSC